MSRGGDRESRSRSTSTWEGEARQTVGANFGLTPGYVPTTLRAWPIKPSHKYVGFGLVAELFHDLIRNELLGWLGHGATTRV